MCIAISQGIGKIINLARFAFFRFYPSDWPRYEISLHNENALQEVSLSAVVKHPKLTLSRATLVQPHTLTSISNRVGEACKSSQGFGLVGIILQTNNNREMRDLFEVVNSHTTAAGLRFKASSICVKSSLNKQRLYFIKRFFTCLTKEIFIPLCSALVIPHLEYTINKQTAVTSKRTCTT